MLFCLLSFFVVCHYVFWYWTKKNPCIKCMKHNIFFKPEWKSDDEAKSNNSDITMTTRKRFYVYYFLFHVNFVCSFYLLFRLPLALSLFLFSFWSKLKVVGCVLDRWSCTLCVCLFSFYLVSLLGVFFQLFLSLSITSPNLPDEFSRCCSEMCKTYKNVCYFTYTLSALFLSSSLTLLLAHVHKNSTEIPNVKFCRKL